MPKDPNRTPTSAESKQAAGLVKNVRRKSRRNASFIATKLFKRFK